MIRMLLRRRETGAEKPSVNRLPLRPRPNVLMAERDGLAVLLDLKREIYLGLDEVGTEIWRGVEAGQTPDEIVGRVAAEFDAPRDAVAADTARFLDDLAVRRLVEAR